MHLKSTKMKDERMYGKELTLNGENSYAERNSYTLEQQEEMGRRS